MTTITMRHTKGAFLVTGKDIEARTFGSRREAKNWCAGHYPGSPIIEIGPGAAKPPHLIFVPAWEARSLCDSSGRGHFVRHVISRGWWRSRDRICYRPNLQMGEMKRSPVNYRDG